MIIHAAGGLRGIVRRYPVSAFAVLVLALSWPILLVGGVEQSPANLWWVLGPGACAFLITWLADGSGGVRELAGRALRWRAPVHWYLFALFGVSGAYLVVSYAVVAALFPANLAPPSVNGLISVAINVVVLFVILLVVEEFGWRGFVLPRLQQRWSQLAATMMVGLLWFAWHLPLYLGGIRWMGYLGIFLIAVLADAVVLTWVFNRTGGSLVLVTLMHAANNAWSAFVHQPVFSVEPPGYLVFEYIRVGVYAVIAVAVIVLTRSRLDSDVHHIDGRRSGSSGDTVPPRGTR